MRAHHADADAIAHRHDGGLELLVSKKLFVERPQRVGIVIMLAGGDPSGSMGSMRPPGGSALAIHRVENPIAVPISSTRLGAMAVVRTRSNRPVAGLTIGTPSLRPVLSISSSTGPIGEWIPSR